MQKVILKAAPGAAAFDQYVAGTRVVAHKHWRAPVSTPFFAQELRECNVLVNSVDPGWVRTQSPEATRSVEEGVETTIWLATLPDGGPSGQFFRDKQPIPW
jgi:hypothetical protein